MNWEPWLRGPATVGHIAPSGFWHAGQRDGCPKCEPRCMRCGDPATERIGDVRVCERCLQRRQSRQKETTS